MPANAEEEVAPRTKKYGDPSSATDARIAARTPQIPKRAKGKKSVRIAVQTGQEAAPPPISARNARLIVLLNSFDTGDAEQQRRELAEFEAGIDAARAGQRSIFGEGFNP